jgi:macrodomain Ter protein organizer (MatP/YcbG family)
LSSWSSSVLPEWIKLAENIQKELGHNDIKKMNNEELENNLANLVRSTAEQLYNSENENSRKFSIKEITTILRKSGGDKNSKETEEDIMVVRVDQSGGDQLENKVDNALIEKYVQLSESIQNKIREVAIVDAGDTKGDTSAMYLLINLKYLVLPKEQVNKHIYRIF